MTLVDTSAWIEFLRDTGSAVCERVDALLSRKIAICDPIRMEVLAGARDDAHVEALRRLLARATVLRTGPADYEFAAGLFRTCRRNGVTVRRLIDCLIAAVAIRENVPVVHTESHPAPHPTCECRATPRWVHTRRRDPRRRTHLRSGPRTSVGEGSRSRTGSSGAVRPAVRADRRRSWSRLAREARAPGSSRERECTMRAWERLEAMITTKLTLLRRMSQVSAPRPKRLVACGVVGALGLAAPGCAPDDSVDVERELTGSLSTGESSSSGVDDAGTTGEGSSSGPADQGTTGGSASSGGAMTAGSTTFGGATTSETTGAQDGTSDETGAAIPIPDLGEPPITCNNAILDGDETDIDCGGPECAPCEVALECLEDEDCASASCDENTDTCAIVPPLVWLDGDDASTMHADAGCSFPIEPAETDPAEVWCWLDKGTAGIDFVAQNGAGEFSAATGSVRMLDDLYVGAGVFSGEVDDMAVFLVQTEVSGRDSFDFNLNDPQLGTQGRYSVHAPWNANRTIMWDVGSTAGRVTVPQGAVEVGGQHMFVFINSELQDRRAIRLDGRERTSMQGAIAAQASNVAIGRKTDAIVHEFRIYTPAPTPEQREFIEGELACRWDLRHLLPAQHLYLSQSGDDDEGCPVIPG